MKKTSILPLSAAMLLSANIAAASQNEVYQQATTVVTASRYEQSKDDIIPSVTVIDRDEIIKLQPNSILDLLSLQQGIDVARTGGNGSSTSVFMRGTNSNHTLVLIDGMRVGSSFTGSFAWEHLPVSQIERIEIVRGTRVSYYGSDAIGGVINIITRKQQNLYVKYTTGSFDTQNFNIGYGKKNDKYSYSLIIGSQKTDGFSATNENNIYLFNPDDDGYENLNLNLSTSFVLKNGKLDFNFLESHGDTDFDTGNSDSKERMAIITWSEKIFDDWNSKISFGNNYNQLKTRVFNSNFSSNRNSIDWIIDKGVKQNHYSLGINYQNESADFNNPHSQEVSFSDSRYNIAAFANWQAQLDKNIISASVRYDDNSVYGNDFSSDFDWAFIVNDKLRFNLSVGTAFRAPSINELFSPNFQGFATSPITGDSSFVFSFEGNPDLQPEESINYEIGLKNKISENHDLSFNLFYYKIDNLIDYQGATFKPVNIFASTIKGLETSYDYKLDSFTLNINATIQDANNDETDKPLLRRPDNKLNISADKFFNKFSFGSSLRYASTSQDFNAELDSYVVLDLRASFKVSDHWRLALKLENVTNEDYQLVNGYNTANASGYLTIEWQQ